MTYQPLPDKHFSDQLELHWLHHSGAYLDREAASNENFAIKIDTVAKESRFSKSIALPNLLDKIHCKISTDNLPNTSITSVFLFSSSQRNLGRPLFRRFNLCRRLPSQRILPHFPNLSSVLLLHRDNLALLLSPSGHGRVPGRHHNDHPSHH